MYSSSTAAVSLLLADLKTELLDQGLSLDAVVTDLAALVVEALDQGLSLDAVVTDLAALEVEALDQGLSLDAMVVDLAALVVEALDQGLSLDAMVAYLAALEVEALDQGLSLDSIDTELTAQGVSWDTALLLDRLPRDCIYRAGPSGGMDGTAVYAGTSTITLSSLPWTVDTLDVLWVEVHRVGGTYEYFDRAVCTVSAGVLTIAGSPALLATDEYVVCLAGPPRGYVAASTNWRTYVTNWNEPVYEEWCQESDATSGATNFYRVSLEGYNNYRFDYDLTNGELKIYTATKPTASTPAEGGAVTSEWNEETDYSPIDTTAGTQVNGAVDVEFTGAIAILFEWTPYGATSELEINGRRGY